MGELQWLGDVSCCEDPAGRGALPAVDLDEAVMIDEHSGILQSQAGGGRRAANCDQEDVRLDVRSVA